MWAVGFLDAHVRFPAFHQYISHHATSLLAAAVVLMLTAICYLIAGLKGQGFVGSKTLGGQGVAQMIV